MKRIFLHTFYITTLSAASVLVSCSSEKNTENAEVSEHISKSDDFKTVSPAYHADESFMSTFKEVTFSYIDIKNALVNGKAEEAKSAAADMVTKIENVDEAALNGEMLQYWEETKDQLHNLGNKIAENDNLKDQRNYFTDLSENMVKAVRSFGASGTTLYEQYCPMANNDTGGTWLSAEPEIRNPYYGSAMLKCGEVKAEIK